MLIPREVNETQLAHPMAGKECPIAPSNVEKADSAVIRLCLHHNALVPVHSLVFNLFQM